ncbi:MAG: hypothetical protein JWO48_996 [Bryobacterales bacterium]|nr:hypothetical protein [Bryobacterales bacterium]
MRSPARQQALFVMQASQHRFREHERIRCQSMSGVEFRDPRDFLRRIRYAKSHYGLS